MRSCNKTYTITEYGGFSRGTASYGNSHYQKKHLMRLKPFILPTTLIWGMRQSSCCLFLLAEALARLSLPEIYVGLITMADGTVIEILPKIVGGDITEGDTKRIFLEMLKTLKDVTFKDFNVSNLHVDHLSLLEIFIKMFLDEVTILTKQGIKAAYTPVEVNERFYKGKLLASQNIKYNLINKERFFVRYDDFNTNRSENRLIKSTLRFLRNTTNDGRNRQAAVRLLNFFDGVEYSTNYDSDFSKCFVDRSMNHYDKALSWCRVFLKGNSFTAFAGSEVALALLFPMEKVFESFVAAKFRKHIGSGVILRTQDARYSLFDSPARAFSLRPDIVLEFDNRTVVLDTKWKLLSDNARNSGISQSDMYQMYAYGKKYEADRIVLLYPYSDAVSKTDIRYASDDNVNVDINFVDLKNADGSISKLLGEVC
jgi:5-methylcytosine-specific restriction enzyme subunit McrC